MSHFTLHTVLSTTARCGAETYCEWSSSCFYTTSIPDPFQNILSSALQLQPQTEGPCGQLPFPYDNQHKEICPEGKKLDSWRVLLLFLVHINLVEAAFYSPLFGWAEGMELHIMSGKDYFTLAVNCTLVV